MKDKLNEKQIKAYEAEFHSVEDKVLIVEYIRQKGLMMNVNM